MNTTFLDDLYYKVHVPSSEDQQWHKYLSQNIFSIGYSNIYTCRKSKLIDEAKVTPLLSFENINSFIIRMTTIILVFRIQP